MTTTTAQWFRRGLGARIDALETAVSALRAEDDPEAAQTIHRMAQALLAPAQAYGFETVYQAATDVEASPESALPDRVDALIAALRAEAAQASAPPAGVLIVGGETGGIAELTRALKHSRRTILTAATAEEATACLRTQPVAVILLHLVLPDLDGRTLLLRLRETPASAAIPVLLFSEDASEAARADVRSLKADSVFGAPLDVAAISAWVGARLRRAHDAAREARRDALTGLMNRAAFTEHFGQSVAAVGTDQPIALALIAIEARPQDGDRHIGTPPDSVLRQVASHITASLRETDVIARWERDEFIALFPGEDPFGGTRAVEKLVALFENRTISTPEGDPYRVSISAGVTLVAPGAALHDVVTEADSYLFQARAAGGNRVVSTQSEPPPRHQHVLLVMRDDVASRVMRHLFEKDGFIPRIANGIAPAAETIDGDAVFNLILIDETLDDGSGFELVSRVRAMPRYNRVPIVMILAQNAEKSVVRALEFGASDYLMRPFSPFTLMTRMRRLLARGSRSHVDSPARTVLVIDDDPGALVVAGSSLHRRGGLYVLLARGVDVGWQRLLRDQPDAVLVAYRLAQVNAEELVGRITGAPETQDTAVILAAEKADEERAARLLTRGVKGLLLKPFEPRGLGA
jgi:two-component system, cell cycle response regulator